MTGLRPSVRAEHVLPCLCSGSGTFSDEAPFIKGPTVTPLACPIWFDITEAPLLMTSICVCLSVVGEDTVDDQKVLGLNLTSYALTFSRLTPNNREDNTLLSYFVDVGGGGLTTMMFAVAMTGVKASVETEHRASSFLASPGARALSGKGAMRTCCYLNNAAHNKTKHYPSPSSGEWLCLSPSPAIIAADFTAPAFSVRKDACLSFLPLGPLLLSPRKWLSAPRVHGGGMWKSLTCRWRDGKSVFSRIFFVSRGFFLFSFLRFSSSLTHPPKLCCIWVSKSRSQLCQCLPHSFHLPVCFSWF